MISKDRIQRRADRPCWLYRITIEHGEPSPAPCSVRSCQRVAMGAFIMDAATEWQDTLGQRIYRAILLCQSHYVMLAQVDVDVAETAPGAQPARLIPIYPEGPESPHNASQAMMHYEASVTEEELEAYVLGMQEDGDATTPLCLQ